MDEPWEQLLQRQHGVFTFAQAKEHGYARGVIRGRERDRVYRKIAPETLYVGGPTALSWDARMWRAVLSLERGVLSHTTAARLWDLRVPALDDVHITVPRELWRPRTDMTIHTAKDLRDADVAERCDLPVTSVERTLIDAFAVLGQAAARRTLIAEAFRLGATTELQLTQCILRMEKIRRRAELIRVIDLAAGGSQSAGEMRLYEFLLRWSLPMPERQYVATLPSGRRIIDCAIPAYKIAIEYDGRHHLTDEQQHDDQLRDEALRRAQWITIRVSERRLRDERLLALDLWANLQAQAKFFGVDAPPEPRL